MNRRSMLLGATAAVASAAPAHTSTQDSTSTPHTCVCPKLDEREGVIVLEGVGQRLSEGFFLEEGRYRVEIEFHYPERIENMAISLHYSDERYDLLYNDHDDIGSASALARATETGECFLEVDTSGTVWKIGISPL